MDLPEYTEAIIVEIGIGGTIGTVSDPRTYLQAYTGPLDGSGIFVGSVYQSCYANVFFNWPTPPYGTRSGPAPCRYTPIPQDVWYDTVLAQGAGRVTRASGIPQFTGDCGGTECHTYSGSQSIKVRPIPVGLTLKASARMITPPAYVTFTPGAIPDYLKGLKVPIRVLTWQWTAAGGSGQTIACGPGTSVCTTQVKESGTMTVTAVVNGVEQTAAVTVECRITQPAPDSILNTPQVRRTMMDALGASNSDSTPESMKRREKGGTIWQLNDGSYFAQTVDDPSATACSYSPSQGPTPPGGVQPVALFHTHPNKPGDKVYGCPESPADRKFSQTPGDGLPVRVADNKERNGGGSAPDWKYARDGYDPQTGILIFAVDVDGRVWRLDPQLSNASGNPALVPNPNNFRAFGGSSPACDWVR